MQTCLSSGLTQLRNSGVHKKGEVYGALFNLSIGAERLMKAIVVIDHMLRNNLVVPSRGDLKAYQHDLSALYSKCADISSGEDSKVPPRANLEPATQEILQLLTDFARQTRYYNLDDLGATAAGKDPLSHFEEILQMVLKTDVPQSTVVRLTESRSKLASALSNISTVVAQGLRGSDLTLEQSIVSPALHDTAARYLVLRVVLLLMPLKSLIGDLSRKVYTLGVERPPIPQMQEFLEFLWEDRRYVLGKKRWP